MPKGSFGKLIALPLQRTAPRRGNTVFFDPATLQPAEDQRAFLAGVPRMSPQAVAAIAESMGPIVLGPGSRKSTHATPRFVRCYREELDLLHLPRGLLPDVKRIVADGRKPSRIGRRPAAT